MKPSFLLPLLLAVVLPNLGGLTFAASVLASEPGPGAGPIRVFFGTYTGGTSKGIYGCTLDRTTGALSAPVLVGETPSPSFLALHPKHRFLYAVNEVDRFDGKPGGSVSAFAVEADTGMLRLLNQKSTQGAGPCHLSVDQDGRSVLVANYGGGSVAVIGVEADGRLGTSTSFIQHRGSSVNPRRQEGPHAHGIYLDAANRFAFVPDLGLDQILIYRFDADPASAGRRSLTPIDPPPFAALPPGAGPRHLAFHPNGQFAYVINELKSTVTAFSYDAARGRLSELQTVSTLPVDFKGESTTAEIAVHPGGRFLYGSNRGHDSLAVFAIDAATGKLSFVEHQPTLGKTPRSFAIDPGGAFLLAANQDSDDVVVFRLDAGNGKLSPAGRSIQVGTPVCVLFAPGR
jgi:6-phosphogluconolactonase